MTPNPGDTIVVWFSCGAASAVAAKKTIELYGDVCNVRIVNNPIKNEDKDNSRFLADVQSWIGRQIEFAVNENYPGCDINEVFEDRRFMSGVLGAPCTQELKKRARQQWEGRNPHNYMVMGFTDDKKEIARSDRFRLTERDNLLPILINAHISRADCFAILKEASIELPRTYAIGWPNGNCPGCVKATSPTYWNFTRQQRPDVFRERAEMSRRLGAKLVRYKGKRIYLDELPSDAIGRPMKNMNIECGIFCEERT